MIKGCLQGGASWVGQEGSAEARPLLRTETSQASTYLWLDREAWMRAVEKRRAALGR